MPPCDLAAALRPGRAAMIPSDSRAQLKMEAAGEGGIRADTPGSRCSRCRSPGMGQAGWGPCTGAKGRGREQP